MSRRQRCWIVRRQLVHDQQAWAHWDQAYQIVLQVSHRQSPNTSRKEERHERGELRASVELPPSAAAHH
jgi:hypothetical protein